MERAVGHIERGPVGPVLDCKAQRVAICVLGAGRNEYGCPCVATVAGEPEICGALLDVPGFGGGPLSAGLELGPDDPPPHAASNETVTSRLIRHPAGALMALTSLTNTPRHLELPPLDTPQFMAARLNRDRPVS